MSDCPSFLGPGAFRFFLAAVVVVHHSFPLRMGAWAVYVFFILSGYWIARMWERKYQRTRAPLLTFLVSRWWRLAPVFVVCTALALTFTNLRPPGGLSFSWMVRQILIIGSVNAGPLLPPAWSLDVEAQFYLLAPLLLWLAIKKRLVILAAGAVVSFGFFLYFSCWPLQPGHWQFPLGVTPYMGFFLCGAILYKTSWSPKKAVARNSIVLFLGITLLLALWPQTRGGIWLPGAVVDFQWWPQVWAAGGALCVLPFVASNVRGRSDSWDRRMGNWAYPLYLFHWLPREWYYHHVSWAMPPWQQVLFLAGNFAAALVGSFLILTFLDGPIDRLRSRWVESRLKPAVPVAGTADSTLVSWIGSSQP